MTGGRAVLIFVLGLGAGARVERAAAAAPEPIGVVAPAGSRLADEVRRELAAAQLPWVSIVAGDRGWPGESSDLGPTPYGRGVVVASDDARLIVVSRGAASGRAEVRFELRFDPNDRPARRRACLAVVEELRALGEPAPSSSGMGAREPEGPAPTAGAVSTAPPTPARPQEVARLAPAPPGGGGSHGPWVMGAATMLDLDCRLGAPMVHLQFTWLISVGKHLAVRAQALWPLMGTELRVGANHARTWTFGAAVGLQYVFALEGARWRPFAGIATGSQFLLTDTPATPTGADGGRALFVPSANLRLQSGVRLALTSHVQLLGEIEATRDWLLQSSYLPEYRDSAANALALHASLGILFEY